MHIPILMLLGGFGLGPWWNDSVCGGIDGHATCGMLDWVWLCLLLLSLERMLGLGRRWYGGTGLEWSSLEECSLAVRGYCLWPESCAVAAVPAIGLQAGSHALPQVALLVRECSLIPPTLCAQFSIPLHPWIMCALEWYEGKSSSPGHHLSWLDILPGEADS